MAKRRFVWALIVLVCTLLVADVYARRKKESLPPPETPGVSKTIAIGDVDAGYDMNGGQAWQVKETIQLALKRELEKKGYVVKITSPAVVTESYQEEGAGLPALPTNRAPTQEELNRYMGAMQKLQMQQSGKVKVHKPVAADAFFEFRIQSGSGSSDTGGVARTIGDLTGLDTSWGSMSTSTTKMYLVCDMRDPASGALEDRHTAKASSVKFKNLGGYTSYDYGNDIEARERLFNKAVTDCAKWIGEKVR